jgi:hypothetical protein
MAGSSPTRTVEWSRSADTSYGSRRIRSWKCLDFATSAEKWESRQLGVGLLVFADGCLYCASQLDCVVSIVAANPTELKCQGQFTLPEKSKVRKPNGIPDPDFDDVPRTRNSACSSRPR